MGMGEWGNGMIITSDYGSFPKIPCVKRTSKINGQRNKDSMSPCQASKQES